MTPPRPIEQLEAMFEEMLAEGLPGLPVQPYSEIRNILAPIVLEDEELLEQVHIYLDDSTEAHGNAPDAKLA